MKESVSKLNNLSKGQVSNWKEKATFRLKNRKWLKYSSNIARRIAASLEERKDLNQKTLAELLNVKPQYISKVLKGEENLTLETISKLSAVLGIELILFPDYKYSIPVENHVLYSSKIVYMQLPMVDNRKTFESEIYENISPTFSTQIHPDHESYSPNNKLPLEMCN